MRLNTKSLLIVSAVAIAIILVAVSLSEIIIQSQVHEFELQEAEDNARSLRSNIELDIDQLAVLAYDYSGWDETYNFVEHGVSTYYPNDMVRIMSQLEVQAMVVVNTSGMVLLSAQLAGDHVVDAPGSMVNVTLDPVFLKEVLKGTSFRGLIYDGASFYLIVLNPVQHNGAVGQPNGAIMMAKRIEGKEYAALSDRVGWPVNGHPYSGKSNDGRPWSEVFGSNVTASYYIDDGHVAASALLYDMNGHPVFVVEMVKDSRSDAFLAFSNNAYLPLLLLVGVLFPLLTIILLRYLVLNRLVRLDNDVKDIKRRRQSDGGSVLDGKVLQASGNDEVADLTRSIEDMLAVINSSEQNLEESERRYRAIVEDQSDLIIRFRPQDESVGYINPAASRFIVSESRVNGFLADFLSAEQLASLRQRVEGLSPLAPQQIVETKLTNASGELRTVQWQIRGLHDAQGALREVQMVGRDNTDFVRMQEEMLRTQKMEALGSLAGGIAHDFNNMLTSILSAGELLRLEGKLDEHANRRLAELLNYVDRAALLSRNLITFSRGGEPVKGKVALADFLRNTAQLSLIGSNVTYALDVAEDLNDALVDESQIFQVFYNLLINARQVMSSGGEVRITAENLPTPPQGLADGMYVQITFKDNGPGIPPEILERIWEPFFTTRKEGSGLGLSIVRSVVQRHGGTVSVRSAVGQGSTFVLVLPAMPHVKGAGRPRNTGTVSVKGKVLLMDDDDAIVDVTVELLRSRGVEVDYAFNGEEAIAKYVKASNEGRGFDVVIMDLTIKGGMGGKDAVQKLRTIDPKAKVVVSSGYSDDPVMANHRLFGFDAVVPKPYYIDQMLEVIGRLMAERH